MRIHIQNAPPKGVDFQSLGVRERHLCQDGRHNESWGVQTASNNQVKVSIYVLCITTSVNLQHETHQKLNSQYS